MPRSEDLVPVLITFNRAGPLRATLGHFRRSAFGQGPFVVLDNASTDGTYDILADFDQALKASQEK